MTSGRFLDSEPRRLAAAAEPAVAPGAYPLEAYREQFPAAANQTYLNHAGVSPTSRRVGEAIIDWTRDFVQHGVTDEVTWESRAERTRALAAGLIGAKSTEIAFVRNTSHGLGLFAEGVDWRPGDEVAVATALEYPSNVYPWIHLASRGVVVRDVEAGDGVLVANIAKAITPKTRVVAVSSVQFATGHRTDIEAIGALCEKRKVLFCVDGIQSVGCLPLDVKACRIHFMSADSHKWMLGINGMGFLYIDEAITDQVRPVIVGWKSTVDAWNFNRTHFELRRDAAKFEEGSPSYTGIYALGAALDLLHEVGITRIGERIALLVSEFERALKSASCQTSPGPNERAGILTFVPHAGDVSALGAHLRDRRICASVRRNRIRISPHFYNNEDDVRALVDAVRAFRG